jgi:hypothetical protein
MRSGIVDAVASDGAGVAGIAGGAARVFVGGVRTGADGRGV